MKKIKNLSESNFLKVFFAFVAASLLIGAVCMPDRGDMFAGLWRIATSPTKLTSNFFAIGGYAGTFLNMGLVGLVCVALFCLPGAVATNVSTLAFLLTVGFCSWGINILNIWPGMLGVVLYALAKKEKPAAYVNAMLFTTGFSPVISELLVRYPHPEAVGFTVGGVVLALVLGTYMGFVLPAGLKHAPNVHKGFDLYSAAVPVGMTAFMVNAVLYKTMGIPTPAAVGADMTIASAPIVNTFLCILFGLMILIAFLLGCKPRDYWNLLIDPALEIGRAHV